ncbi:MAG: pilus assembly protein TadG-related protein [Xanthobacteraceae bacterium]
MKSRSLALIAQFARLRSRLASFRGNTRGNVAIICALCAIPLVSAVGCVIDYSMASLVKTKLQAAADAATVASVSFNSSIIPTAQGMSGNGSISGGSTQVVNYFNANLSSAPADTGYTGLTSTATVSKSGMVLTAGLTFSAQVPTYFMGILGFKNISISGSSTASYTLPTYIDFYLMVDVSGSMSFPATTSEQTRLMDVNPDNYGQYPSGCTFACHFTAQGACSQSEQGSTPSVGSTTNPKPGGYCQGFIISRLGTTPASGTLTAANVNWSNTQVSSCPNSGTTSCIELRADAVGYAVNELLATAASSEIVSNQFRVGLYPFIQYLYSYFPLTNSLSGSPTTSGTINYAAANLASLLDTGANSNLGSGGTHFENALPSMSTLITSVGTGANSSNTLPYVFLITDGSQDCQTQWNGSWSGTGSSCSPYYNSSTTVNTSWCTPLKNRGITIAILYIPYETIQDANSSFANNEDGYANSNIPNIPAALEACASPNFYYTASTPADINSALIAMFEQAVSTAHLTD